jgi:hypothetical protein
MGRSKCELCGKLEEQENIRNILIEDKCKDICIECIQGLQDSYPVRFH